MAEMLDVITLPDGRTGTVVEVVATHWLVEISGDDGVPIEFVWTEKHG